MITIIIIIMIVIIMIIMIIDMHNNTTLRGARALPADGAREEEGPYTCAYNTELCVYIYI